MADKQKNKGKTHPFANELRSTEEVLWLSSSTKISSEERLQSGYLLIIVLIMLAGGIALADGASLNFLICRCGIYVAHRVCVVGLMYQAPIGFYLIHLQSVFSSVFKT